MRRVIVTQTWTWEEEIPDVGVEVDEIVEMLLEDDPDTVVTDVEVQQA